MVGGDFPPPTIVFKIWVIIYCNYDNKSRKRQCYMVKLIVWEMMREPLYAKRKIVQFDRTFSRHYHH